ncbi:hypothetical protein K3495_g9155 [Podosphaera aphanis]|nr:hypothetical protein K3495_g9155 [Podosphaera aphanis]
MTAITSTLLGPEAKPSASTYITQAGSIAAKAEPYDRNYFKEPHENMIADPELVDHIENNHEIDLPKDSPLDKQVNAELRIRERHRRQATYDPQTQVHQSEEREESEDVRLHNASAYGVRNSRTGRPNNGFTTTANDHGLLTKLSDNRRDITNSDQNCEPTHHYAQQTTQSKFQPPLQVLAPIHEISRAGPPTDRRMLTELAKSFNSDNMIAVAICMIRWTLSC